MALEVEFDAKELFAKLDVLEVSLPKNVEVGLQRSMAFFEKRVDRRFTGRLSGPWRINKSRNKLANRTGDLRRSFRSEVTRDRRMVGANYKATASIGKGTKRPYAKAQEYGAAIRSKRGKYVAVPAPDNLFPSGRKRFATPRQTPGAFFIRTKKKKLMLVRRSESGGLDYLWLMKRSVRIPPRLGFGDTWNAESVARARRRYLRRSVDAALTSARLR